MIFKTSKPKSIAEYIKAAPKETQRKLRQMRSTIRKAAPGAVESLKWGMPAFSYRRILVAFAAFRHHIGFYPTPAALKKILAKDMAKYKTGKGSIQFPLDRPLPLSLIRKITAFRVQASVKKDRKWRS